jgi:predicted nuclease with TOPRIM domain
MSVAEDTGGTGLTHARSASDLLRLPPSPITSDQAGGAAPQTRFAETSKTVQLSKKHHESTRLPSVLQDVASLEHERAKLTQELSSLREAHQALAAKLKQAEEHKLRQLEVMGKYDRFFLNDKGQHPLGRRYAVQQTAVTIQKYVAKLENQKVKLLTKLNQAVDANNAVKTRIDVLRRESVVFRELFAKMEGELQGLKKEISSNKTQLEAAYEARDAAQYEMLEIQEELKLTKADFEAELQATAAAANVAVPDTSASLNMSMFDSSVMGSVTGTGGPRVLHRTRSIKGVDRNSSAMRKLTKQQKFKQMEDDWKAIIEATGMSSAEELVAFFKEAEVQVSYDSQLLF